MLSIIVYTATFIDGLFNFKNGSLLDGYAGSAARVAAWSLYAFAAGSVGTGIWVIAHECEFCLVFLLVRHAKAALAANLRLTSEHGCLLASCVSSEHAVFARSLAVLAASSCEAPFFSAARQRLLLLLLLCLGICV